MSRRVLHALAAAALSLAACAVHAEKAPLSDEELGDVAGKGISILVHLELNSGLLTGQNIDSRVSAGFDVGGQTTWVVAQNFGGLLDLFAITIAPVVGGAGGRDYLSIGMPTFIGAKEFGVRAIGVQTDPTATITNSLGSLLLNGTGTMTGQLNIWPK